MGMGGDGREWAGMAGMAGEGGYPDVLMINESGVLFLGIATVVVDLSVFGHNKFEV